jgi:hypothetical protein
MQYMHCDQLLSLAFLGLAYGVQVLVLLGLVRHDQFWEKEPGLLQVMSLSLVIPQKKFPLT